MKYFGEVVWFESRRGFGFISYEIDGNKQSDMFVHFSDIICSGYKTLYKEQKVSFEIGKNHKGMPKAINVVVEKSV